MVNQLLGVLLHTMAISGLSRVRTELSQLLVIPFFPHHPVLTPPFRQAPHGHLCRFHQQETQQRVPPTLLPPRLSNVSSVKFFKMQEVCSASDDRVVMTG